MAARAADGGHPVVAHVVLTPGQARDVLEVAMAVLVMTPVATAAGPEAALIRGLFDLRAHEARVACSLTEGLSPHEIATFHGAGVETVRSHIKAVLNKTGTRHQAQATGLLRGLAQIPIVGK